MSHKTKIYILLICFLLALSACSSAAQGPAEMPPDKEGMASLNKPFQLKFDEAILLPDENIWVRFASVISDNRCPQDVQCVQAGEARIILSISVKDQNAIQIELSTTLDQAAVVVEGYQILLQAVEPLPPSSGQPTPEKDYVVTILISRP